MPSAETSPSAENHQPEDGGRGSPSDEEHSEDAPIPLNREYVPNSDDPDIEVKFFAFLGRHSVAQLRSGSNFWKIKQRGNKKALIARLYLHAVDEVAK